MDFWALKCWQPINIHAHPFRSLPLHMHTLVYIYIAVRTLHPDSRAEASEREAAQIHADTTAVDYLIFICYAPSTSQPARIASPPTLQPPLH